jgi:proteasome assembly chaperone (PAC2) family protein
MITTLLLAATAGAALAQQDMRCGMGGAGQMSGGMGMDSGMMMRMDSTDAALDSLTKIMNSTTGTRKVNAMATVLNTMVGHHREMHRAMRNAEPGMHGMTGGRPGAGCAMMQSPGPDSTAAPGVNQDH